MKKLKLKGNSSEEKLDHVERILRHFQNRLGTKVIGFVPGIPMSAYAQKPLDNGIIVSFVMVANGSVGKSALVIRKYNAKKAVRFHLILERASAKYHETFLTKKEVSVVNVGFDVEIGDVITLSVDESDIDKIEDIWLGMLLNIDYKSSINTFENFVLDELEKLNDEGIRELTD